MVVEKVCVVAIKPFNCCKPDPPVELTISNENPRGAVEEAVKTFPSAPVKVASTLVPDAITIPRVKLAAPVPPEPTPKALVRFKVVIVEVPLTTKDLVEEDQVKFASPAKTPPLLYWIWLVEPPGFPPPQPVQVPWIVRLFKKVLPLEVAFVN